MTTVCGDIQDETGAYILDEAGAFIWDELGPCDHSATVIDSFARGGGASRKQLKKYQQAEDRFQRLKRAQEEALFAPKLKNMAELGGPKALPKFVVPIDDDDDDYDIMMWAAQ